jgi:uncharacterized membrane protein
MADPSGPEGSPRRGYGWLGWAIAIATMPGFALWAWTRPDAQAYLGKNLLEYGTPLPGLLFALGSGILVGLLYLRADKQRKRDESAPPRHVVMGELNRRLLVLLAILPLSILGIDKVEAREMKLLVPLIFSVAVMVVISLYAWQKWFETRKDHVVVRVIGRLQDRRLAIATLVLLTVGWIALMIDLGLTRHWGLGSRIFDLGIFDNLMFNGLHGRWHVTTFQKSDTFTSGHFAPLLHVLTPIYSLSPKAETLIVIQAIWLAAAVVPIYVLTVDRLQRPWTAVVVCCAYLMHPSLHGVTLFDFHALILMTPLFLWAVWTIRHKAWRRYVVLVALLLLTREDMAFMVGGLGLYAWWSHGHRRLGLITIAVGIGYFFAVKQFVMLHPDVFMPSNAETYGFANRFGGLIPDPETGGASDIVATLLTNPAYVVQHVLRAPKVWYLVLLATPTMFIALVQKPVWPLLAWGIAFSFLASGSNLFNPYLHYTLFLVPALVIAIPEGIATLERLAPKVGLDPGKLGACLAAGVLVSASLAGDNYGALGDSRMFRAGYVEGVPEPLSDKDRDKLAWVRQAAASVPQDAWLSVSNRLGPHASNRPKVRMYQHHPDADYLLIARGDLSKDQKRALRKKVRKEEYERIDEWHKKLELYKRTSPWDPESQE